MKNPRSPIEFVLVSYIFNYFDQKGLDRKLINSLIMKKREDKILSHENFIDKNTDN